MEWPDSRFGRFTTEEGAADRQGGRHVRSGRSGEEICLLIAAGIATRSSVIEPTG
jgi:hypothetical protein